MDYLEPKETARLLLRPLTLDDIPLLEPFYRDPRTTLYFPNSMQGDTQQAEILIRKQLGRYLSDSFGLHALIWKEKDVFIGMCGLLLQYVGGQEEVEIGYHLLPDYWGQGFATEAAVFFKDYAFEYNLTDSIISIIHVDNNASQNVAERNGMKRDKQITFGGVEVYVYRVFNPGHTAANEKA